MRISRRSALAIILLSAIAFQTRTVADTPSETEIQKLVQELGHRKSAVRRKALTTARALKPKQLKLLVRALQKTSDPELKAAAQQLQGLLLDQICEGDQVVNKNAVSVRDGTVILLRRGNVFGAFVIGGQTSKPEQCSYQWVLMPPGVTEIDPKGKGAKTGKGKAGRIKARGEEPIAFGPFKIYWSGGGKGSGWVYHNYFPESRGDKKTRTVMHIVGKGRLGKIDALARDVVFKYNPKGN